MGIGGFAALVALGDDVFRDPLPQPVVEYKVLPMNLLSSPCSLAGVHS